jgi:hypothetical protein
MAIETADLIDALEKALRVLYRGERYYTCCALDDLYHDHEFSAEVNFAAKRLIEREIAPFHSFDYWYHETNPIAREFRDPIEYSWWYRERRLEWLEGLIDRIKKEATCTTSS